MSRDEVIEEIRRFKGEFITYADTAIKYQLQQQNNSMTHREDGIYRKFTDVLDVPALKKDISTINKQLTFIDDAKSNIENQFIGIHEKLDKLTTEQYDAATLAKRNNKSIQNIQIPDINETNKSQQLEIHDLQMRTTVLEDLTQVLKRKVQMKKYTGNRFGNIRSLDETTTRGS